MVDWGYGYGSLALTLQYMLSAPMVVLGIERDAGMYTHAMCSLEKLWRREPERKVTKMPLSSFATHTNL